MSRASTRSERGRLGAALALSSVRGLLVLFCIGTAVAVGGLAEGARLRAEVAALEEGRRLERLLEGVGAAVQALGLRLETAAPQAGESPWAVEARAVRERVEALAAAAPRLRIPAGPLLEEVARAEAAAAGPAGGRSALRTALEGRWGDFEDAVQGELVRDAEDRLWRLGERSRLQHWVLLFVGVAAVVVLGAAVHASGGGARAAQAQARALGAGDWAGAGAAFPEEARGDLAELRSGLAAAARGLAAAEAARRAERAASERFFQRVEAALAGIAAGETAQPLPAADDPACAGALAALARVVERLRGLEAEAAAERARLQGLLPVRREELYQLGQLFELDPERQAQAAAAFQPESPLRALALRLGALAGAHRLLVAGIGERAGRIVAHSETVATLVGEREGDFRRESQLIHETSTTVNEVSVAAKQTAQMVEFVFRSSQEAMQAAEEGREYVRRTLEGMTLIEQRVSRTAEQILQLAGKTQEIGAIVKAIGDVSRQTNLLALNAAIEAAGAGEHGKGFAVVAKEIRELAVKSARSAQDIQRLIGEIQAATNAAVLSTEEGSKSVHGGVLLANALNQAFALVLEKFQEVLESTQQISTAAQEQTTGARQVATSIGTIDQMMRTTVEDLQGLRQLLAQYREIADDLERTLRRAAAAGGGA